MRLKVLSKLNNLHMCVNECISQFHFQLEDFIKFDIKNRCSKLSLSLKLMYSVLL